MNDIYGYETILNTTIQYQKDSRKILNGLERIDGWKKIAKNHENLFKNTSYFQYGIDKFNQSPTFDKYSFLNCYYDLFHWGFLPSYPHRYTSFELKIIFLTDFSEIFGPDLVTANAQQIILDSSFDPKDYIGKPTFPGHVAAFEFAPIIDAWFDMWVELKGEWKEDFNEKYLSYDLLNTLHPKLLAYQKFLNKREDVVDHLFKTGRIKTKNPAWFT